MLDLLKKMFREGAEPVSQEAPPVLFTQAQFQNFLKAIETLSRVAAVAPGLVVKASSDDYRGLRVVIAEPEAMDKNGIIVTRRDPSRGDPTAYQIDPVNRIEVECRKDGSMVLYNLREAPEYLSLLTSGSYRPFLEGSAEDVLAKVADMAAEFSKPLPASLKLEGSRAQKLNF